MKSGSQETIMEADITIIGGGGSGLAAALSAAEKGNKKIVILEKRAGLGGNTAWATGLFACESPTQSRNKIIADKDELFKHVMEWNHWGGINPRIFRAFLNKSGDTIRWLEAKGLEFTVIAFFPNQNPRVEHVANGKGAELTRVLVQQCKDAGVNILLHCAGTKILMDAQGNICAIRAEKEGGTIEIKSRVVIIATGGFGANKPLLKKLCPDYIDNMSLRGLPLMGDGIQLAAEAGAKIESFVTLLKEGPRIDANSWPLRGLEREPMTVWVNKSGKRFTDEAIGNHPFESVNAVLDQPDHVCYTLVDSAVKETLGEKIPDLDNALQLEIEKGRVIKSASWVEIANWIGASPEVLKNTVDEFNGYCEHGYDAVFAKDRRWLRPLSNPPFFAIKGNPHFLDTLGGIRINEHMQVLNSEDKVISGLYAAGVITSGWEGDVYCSDLNGSAFGYAINSGRIAGENAAAFIQGNPPTE
jgi:fumarate reductase flavoprotein subunit